MSVLAASVNAIRRNPVVHIGSNGITGSSFMKMLPIELAVARKSAKYNRIGLFLPDTNVAEGDYVRDLANDWYIIANLNADSHKGEIVRYMAELVFCSHIDASVVKPTVQRDQVSGSIIGDATQVLHQNVKLLFTTVDITLEDDRGVDIGSWNIYVSKHLPELKAETTFLVNGKSYEIKYSRHDMQGVVTYRVMRATR